MDPMRFRCNDDGTLWGFSTLERTRRLGQQTYQRALKNHAAWMKPKGRESATDPFHQERLLQGACPICGKSVEPNLQLESAFCNVKKMMHQISQTCQKYYCSKEGEPQTVRDVKHCMRYHCSNTKTPSQTVGSLMTGSQVIGSRETMSQKTGSWETMSHTMSSREAASHTMGSREAASHTMGSRETLSQKADSQEIQELHVDTAYEDPCTSGFIKSTSIHSPQMTRRTKPRGQTTFDIAASLPHTKKVKHVRFSPGETLEVHFCV